MMFNQIPKCWWVSLVLLKSYFSELCNPVIPVIQACNISGVARIFFEGDAPALKGYHTPPAGGPGDEGPRRVGQFHFLKRCKVLEN